MRYAIFLLIALACAPAQTKTPAPHGRETDTETIWTARYSNCDYGFYVVLPTGVVGHGAKPPAPNRGFAIDPAAARSTDTFNAADANRYIEVSSFYDLEDHEESTAGTLNYYSSLGDIGDQKDLQTVNRQSFGFLGLSARRTE